MAYRPSFSEAAWLAVGVVGTAAAAFSPSCALAQNAPATKAQPAAASAPVITLQTDCKTYRTGTGFFDAAACEVEKNQLERRALNEQRQTNQEKEKALNCLEIIKAAIIGKTVALDTLKQTAISYNNNPLGPTNYCHVVKFHKLEDRRAALN